MVEEQKLSVSAKLISFFKSLIYSSWDILKTVIVSTAVVIIITQVFIVNAVVPTSSMVPTLPVGGYMLCLRTDYWFSSPKRGDIVVFRRDNGEKTIFTKRIVGEPGDTVEIKNGITYINGEKYDEPWLAETPADEDYGPYEVPEGDYFCMGDNRNNSKDSRSNDVGQVDMRYIMGKAYLRIWPLNALGTV